jgi:putative ABC transport system permease protein
LRLLSDLAARLRSLLFARREDAELDEEIHFHIDRDIEKNLAAGMGPREARRQAHIKFGGVERMRERTREARGVQVVEALLWDIPRAVRSLRSSWVVSVTALVTIALGVALTTTTFSLVWGLLIDPLPYPGADRLMGISLTAAEGGPGQPEFEALDLRDFRNGQRSFESVEGYFRRAAALTDGDGFVQSVIAGIVTAGALDAVGVAPHLGRTFRAGEDFRSDIGQVVLGYETWMQRYGGDPRIVGRTVRVDERSLEVIGVMPPEFSFPVAEEMWLPMDFDMPTTDRGSGRSFEVFGRLHPGVGVAAATAEAWAIVARIGAETGSPVTLGAMVRPLAERHLPGGLDSMLQAMLAAVAGVLIIACASVANLLLARALPRGREVAIRTALGAPRHRIAQQFLLESLLLSIAGCLLGLGLAAVGMDAIQRSLAALPLPSWADVSLTAPALVLVGLLIVLVTVAAGVLPAVHALRADGSAALGDGSRGSTGAQVQRWGRLLVTAQVALSCALLTGAGLLVKSIMELRTHDLGYEPERVLAARFRVPTSDFPTPAERSTLMVELIDRASTLPGARGASIVRSAPGSGPTFSWDFVVEGEEYPSRVYPAANGVPVAHGYFAALGIPILQGRDFTPEESRFGAEPALIVTETVAQRYLGPEPIGRRIRIGVEDGEAPWYEVVGVVGDTYVGSRSGGIGLDPAPTPQVYVSWGVAPYSAGTLLVASEGDPLALGDAVRGLLRTLGPTVPLYDASRLDVIIDDTTWAFGLFGTVFTVFGVLALVLSAVGLYGVTAFSVGQRRSEMSVRMALGARAERIVLMVFGEVGLRIGIGIALGTVASLFVGRGIRAILFGVAPLDVSVYAVVVGTVAAVGLAAALLPALRASRAQPAQSLGS